MTHSCPRLRYPLIIDPSGQATEFIMNEYKDRKITRTSFLDDAFRKNLESALRFGNPLLVQVREAGRAVAVILWAPRLETGRGRPCLYPNTLCGSSNSAGVNPEHCRVWLLNTQARETVEGRRLRSPAHVRSLMLFGALSTEEGHTPSTQS